MRPRGGSKSARRRRGQPLAAFEAPARLAERRRARLPRRLRRRAREASEASPTPSLMVISPKRNRNPHRPSRVAASLASGRGRCLYCQAQDEPLRPTASGRRPGTRSEASVRAASDRSRRRGSCKGLPHQRQHIPSARRGARRRTRKHTCTTRPTRRRRPWT